MFAIKENQDKAGCLSNVMEWTDFVYVPENMGDLESGKKIIAYSPPSNYRGKGTVVLFNNAEVKWIGREQLENITLPSHE